MIQGTISAMIATPGGATFQLVLIPANNQAQTLTREEEAKCKEAAARGERHKIDLDRLCPGFFGAQTPEAKPPETSASTVDTLLHDATWVLVQFEQGTQKEPEHARQQLSTLINHVIRHPLDARQQRWLECVRGLAQKHGAEVA